MKPEKTDKFRTIEDRMNRLAEASKKEADGADKTEARDADPTEKISDEAPEDAEA